MTNDGWRMTNDKMTKVENRTRPLAQLNFAAHQRASNPTAPKIWDLGFGISFVIRHWSFVFHALLLCLALQFASGQDSPLTSSLPRARFRSGDETLRAFSPVSEATRNSIVKLNVDGETVALGLVMDANGLVLTKASEIKKGKLT